MSDRDPTPDRIDAHFARLVVHPRDYPILRPLIERIQRESAIARERLRAEWVDQEADVQP